MARGNEEDLRCTAAAVRQPEATGLRNVPFDLWHRIRVCLELVLAAEDLTRWAQALLLDGELATAEPKTCAIGCSHVAARVVRHAHRVVLRLHAAGPGRPSSPERKEPSES